MDQLAGIAPFVVIAALFWFLLIRPAQRRQRQQLSVQRSAQPGSQVMLSSGIFGTIVEENDDTLTLEIAPGTIVKVARAAIARVLEDEPEQTSEKDVDEQVDETADETAPNTPNAPTPDGQ